MLFFHNKKNEYKQRDNFGKSDNIVL